MTRPELTELVAELENRVVDNATLAWFYALVMAADISGDEDCAYRRGALRMMLRGSVLDGVVS